MVHRVSASFLRLSRFDDDVATEVGDFAAVFSLGEMLELQRLVECELLAIDRLDEPLFGLDIALLVLARSSLFRGRENGAVSHAPPLHRLGERDGCNVLFRRLTE